MKLSFSPERPEHCPAGVWAIQQELLARAEALLGQRDRSKIICQPIFVENGPNTPDLSGAFAALSMRAAGYWPTVVYELAHETVHLLNPVEGYTNWLEEGVAEAFAVEMSRILTTHPITTDASYPAYVEALALVRRASRLMFRRSQGGASRRGGNVRSAR